MKDNELIEILKEFDKKRVEQLNENARNLFNAIMDIADSRDRLLEEKQELIDYLKEQINYIKNNFSQVNGNYFMLNDKLETYEEILSKLVESDQIEKE